MQLLVGWAMIDTFLCCPVSGASCTAIDRSTLSRLPRARCTVLFNLFSAPEVVRLSFISGPYCYVWIRLEYNVVESAQSAVKILKFTLSGLYAPPAREGCPASVFT